MVGLQAHRTARDERVIRDILGSFAWPEALTDIDLEFGEDRAGEPAVWVWLLVEHDIEPPTDTVRELSDFAQAIRWSLTEPDLDHWPYVGFRTVEPEAPLSGVIEAGTLPAEPSWLRFC